MRLTVKAPATSANLGPGFDVLGIALDIWNEAVIDTDGVPNEVITIGAEASMMDGRENLTLSAMLMLANDFRRELPPFSLRATTGIPVSRGLGSSAAALVMGLAATNALLDLDLDNDDLFDRAWHIEGHGDNVGAAVYGGAVMSVPGLHGVTRLWSDGEMNLVAVLFIPDMTGATHAARAALPANVPHKDATANVANVSALAVGLASRDHHLIGAGMHDMLHEPYRAKLFPHLVPLQEVARTAGAVGAVLSGAGPAVLALTPPDLADNVRIAMLRASRDVATPGRVEIVELSTSGLHLSSGS